MFIWVGEEDEGSSCIGLAVFGLELDEVGRVGESIIVLPDSNRLAWGGRIDQNRVAVKAHHI